MRIVPHFPNRLLMSAGRESTAEPDGRYYTRQVYAIPRLQNPVLEIMVIVYWNLQILLYGAVFAVGVAIMAVTLLKDWLLTRAAKIWPFANATVEIIYAVRIGPRNDHWWIPVLGYSYEVDGQRYSGSVGLNGSGAHDKETAQEAGNAWRGRKIVIRFDPQRPEKSAFLPEDGAPRNAINYADQPPDSADVITLSLK